MRPHLLISGGHNHPLSGLEVLISSTFTSDFRSSSSSLRASSALIHKSHIQSPMKSKAPSAPHTSQISSILYGTSRLIISPHPHGLNAMRYCLCVQYVSLCPRYWLWHIIFPCLIHCFKLSPHKQTNKTLKTLFFYRLVKWHNIHILTPIF